MQTKDIIVSFTIFELSEYCREAYSCFLLSFVVIKLFVMKDIIY